MTNKFTEEKLKEFDEEFGKWIVRQKAHLYNSGEYSSGTYTSDFEIAEREVNELKNFLSQAIEEARKEQDNIWIKILQKAHKISDEDMKDIITHLTKVHNSLTK